MSEKKESFVEKAKAEIAKRKAEEAEAASYFTVEDILAGTEYRKKVAFTVGGRKGAFELRPFNRNDLVKAQRQKKHPAEMKLLAMCITQPELTVEQVMKLPALVSAQLSLELSNISGMTGTPLELSEYVREAMMAG